MREAADRLDALDPPADAADANQGLVKALRDFAAELEQFATDAQSGNVAAVKRFDQLAAANSLPAEKELREVARKLAAAGYTVRG